MSGTHSGEYEGRVGSGRTFEVEEVDIFDVVNDRITGYRIVWDDSSDFRRTDVSGSQLPTGPPL